MTLRHYIEYVGLRVLIRLALASSPGHAGRFGERLGDLAFGLLRRRRRLAEGQMRRVFGDTMREEDIRRLARDVYRQLGRIAVEHARMLGGGRFDLRERLRITGAEHVADALRQGHGVILVTGHFGYWELLGAAVASLGFRIAVVAKDQHNPAVNILINGWRERSGMAVIPMASATRRVVRTLKENGCVGFLADQDAGPGGVFVDFLGRPASTYRGPARFALRTGAPIVPCFILHDGTARFHAVFEPAIHALPTGDEETDVGWYTGAYTWVLERYVRAYPDHWFWVHRRWKTPVPAQDKGNTEQEEQVHR